LPGPCRCEVTGAARSIVINGDGVAFGYAAGFKSSGTSGERRYREQLVALKQQSTASSRLLASYLIFGKSLSIKAALDLHGPAAAAIHGKKLLARGGRDAMHVSHFIAFIYLILAHRHATRSRQMTTGSEPLSTQI
jgi:hypothetical protein